MGRRCLEGGGDQDATDCSCQTVHVFVRLCKYDDGGFGYRKQMWWYVPGFAVPSVQRRSMPAMMRSHSSLRVRDPHSPSSGT